MPRWTEKDLESYQAKRERVRSRPIIQELKDVDRPKANHQAGKAGVDGQVHPKFRIAITLLVSDKRCRDGDGALSTLLDCVVTASRRFHSLDP